MLVALHWVAFGPGVRRCSGGVSIPFLSTRTGVGNLGCRTAFGLVAVFFDGLPISAALAHVAERRLEGGRKRVPEALSKGVLLLVLLPLLPLLLLAMLLKSALVLREVDGLSRQEICKILDVSVTNPGVTLHRVRNRPRECLEAKGLEP